VKIPPEKRSARSHRSEKKKNGLLHDFRLIPSSKVERIFKTGNGTEGFGTRTQGDRKTDLRRVGGEKKKSGATKWKKKFKTRSGRKDRKARPTGN